MKYDTTIFRSNIKNIFRCFIARSSLVALLLVAFLLPAVAQENVEKPKGLVPNLTVNIKLNSALSEEETEFYSKIAQDLINKLPRELKLDKQLGALKEFDSAYEHINVVTYLPPTDNVETDKLIKHFKVKFTFDDEDGANSAEQAGDVIFPPASRGETIVGLKQPDTTEKAPEVIKKAVIKVLPQEPKAKPVTRKMAKPAPKTSASSSVEKVRLVFDMDESYVTAQHRKTVMDFINNVRQNNKEPEGFVFVVRSYEGPLDGEYLLGEVRLRLLTALLRQQDINVSRSRVTEIFVHTNKEQFIEIQPIY